MTTEPLAYLNGRFVPQGELVLSAFDAGFVSAATVTDFARTYGRRLFRWPDHLARFRRDCANCLISLPDTDSELTAVSEELLATNSKRLAPNDELALITFATPGPLAYLTGALQNGPPTVGMHTFRLPTERYARFFTGGAVLAVAGTHDRSSLIPAGTKHRSRLHWWLAERAIAAKHPGAVAVLVDEHGASADTAIGGVLVAVDNIVYRSPVGSVQDSISLQVAKEGCRKLGLEWVETAFDFEALARPIEPVEKGGFSARVSEVLLAGSGFGIAGVSRCATAFIARDFTWPGPVYQQLAGIWSSLTE